MMVTDEGIQGMSTPKYALCNMDYFELRHLEKQVPGVAWVFHT